MAIIEAVLHINETVRPRVKVHRDGRRAEVTSIGGEGSAFTLSGDPVLLRRWLELALHDLEIEVLSPRG